MQNRSATQITSLKHVPFEVEEIESAIRKLKCGKSGGADGLQPEHIKYGGHSITLWFQSIFNKISTLEDLPPCLKLGVTIPVFKGKGRDPLNPDNYRGITLTSVISKCLELVLLSRLESVLMDKGLPHHGQTAYRKGISCADAIFSTQEAVLQRMRDGEHPTLCCFDLEKAFDSIEYPVLLEHLFKLGINGKCWRLLHNWYSNSRSVVRLNSNTSQCFPVCRGVKQGSVLSPTQFIIVIDSLLTSLDTTHQGLSHLGLDVGSSAHADDIRVVSNSTNAVSRLGSCVSSFCSANQLKLNAGKTEAVSFSKGCPPDTTLQIASDSIKSQPQLKCLGVWWQHDLSPSMSVEENISKARRAFFATGSLGSFHGKLNPLSARSIFEIFVIPVLLYGCETWILTPTLMTKLEKFQAEIGRRLLGISRYHADLAPLIGLHLPSMMARVFIRKLSFLAKLLTSNEDTQSSRTFRTCAADNVYNISLIQQCQWLQCTLNIEQILQQCLENPDSAVLIVKSARNSILRRDWANTVHLAKSHMSLKHIVSSNDIASGWCRIWDSALDQGYRGTKLSQCLFRSLCHPLFCDRKCQYCDAYIPSDMTHFQHLCQSHLNFSESQLPALLDEGGDNLFQLASRIMNLSYIT